MANLPETPQWEEGIYQIEVSDPVLGGPDGISNRQGKQLASRTLYLKQQVEKGGTDLAAHIAAADPHTQYAPKASPTFTGTPTAPTPANSDNSKSWPQRNLWPKRLPHLLVAHLRRWIRSKSWPMPWVTIQTLQPRY